MITKELETNKMCLFCASEYHLEMILLPYIKERINEKIASLKDFKLKRSGKILVFGNKKAVNDYTGL